MVNSEPQKKYYFSSPVICVALVCVVCALSVACGRASLPAAEVAHVEALAGGFRPVAHRERELVGRQQARCGRDRGGGVPPGQGLHQRRRKAQRERVERLHLE